MLVINSCKLKKLQAKELEMVSDEIVFIHVVSHEIRNVRLAFNPGLYKYSHCDECGDHAMVIFYDGLHFAVKCHRHIVELA